MNIKSILTSYSNDPSRMMDILIDIQDSRGYISEQDIVEVADGLGVSKVEVVQALSFYHFFHTKPSGKYTVYLNNSVVAQMAGRAEVAKAFEEAAGIKFGQVTADGLIGLFDTADIGMNDQEPAALINGHVFTSLTPQRVREIVEDMKAGKSPEQMITQLGDGANSLPTIRSMVRNNIRRPGPVVFDSFTPVSALTKAISMSPDDVIWEIKRSNLRGRGGAGFPVGMKWEFCRKAQGTNRFIICNADEGEPGTFKDRVILTERAEMLFEGMVIGGYAIGASSGILYLRGEYRYLKKHLESVLQRMRENNLLGKNILGKDNFDFDIRIQLGAGAYVCGEESGLIESAEGKRGEPRNRPPFPAEKGYKDNPTAVNNVETFCNVVRIILKGHDWFRTMGTDQSSGTKVLSISGDCSLPGIYEVEWGTTINELLEMSGATDVQAVQVGGPSGVCVAPKDFNRKLCFTDMSTGGSIIIINKKRNLLDIVKNFVDFFTDESCGVCISCRVGNMIMQKKLRKIMKGRGVAADLDDMLNVGATMRIMSRCGLGQTASNPVVTTIQNFRDVYDSVVQKDKEFDTEFDMQLAIQEASSYTKRIPPID